MNRFPDETLLAEHCKRFAVEQGHSTCFYDRREYLHQFLQTEIDKRALKTLEIGCGGNPFLSGRFVKYFETQEVDSLKRHYIELGRTIEGFPKKFHFVSPNGDLSVVDQKFDIVLSSHVIEHCPDPVDHFQKVSNILNKGGLYILLVPDKRYCFDHYNPESDVAEVSDAFISNRKTPRLADVIHHGYNRTHNIPILHWLGEHGERFGNRSTPLEPDARIDILGESFRDDGKGLKPDNFLRMIEKYAESLDKDEYISAHNWRFTPDSFGRIIKLLNELRFIDLTLYRLCNTIWGRLEFVAMLEKI